MGDVPLIWKSIYQRPAAALAEALLFLSSFFLCVAFSSWPVTVFESVGDQLNWPAVFEPELFKRLRTGER